MYLFFWLCVHCMQKFRHGWLIIFNWFFCSKLISASEADWRQIVLHSCGVRELHWQLWFNEAERGCSLASRLPNPPPHTHTHIFCQVSGHHVRQRSLRLSPSPPFFLPDVSDCGVHVYFTQHGKCQPLFFLLFLISWDLRNSCVIQCTLWLI